MASRQGKRNCKRRRVAPLMRRNNVLCSLNLENLKLEGTVRGIRPAGKNFNVSVKTLILSSTFGSEEQGVTPRGVAVSTVLSIARM